MNITAIPRENINSVSTRVHYYYYLNNMPAEYKWEKHNGNYKDLLYVQKKADEKTIKIAEKAKKRGIPVVYDCDDNPYSKKGKDRIAMLRLSDAVTTDTKERAIQLAEKARINKEKIFVIPECVDYYGLLKKNIIRENISTVITFGNNANAVNAAKYMENISCECRHINSKEIKGCGKFIKWKLSTFVEEMNKADVCLLVHGDDRKSNLKLLVCIHLGIPTIVSNTKSYRNTYVGMGLSRLIVNSPKDVKTVLDYLKKQSVRKNLQELYSCYYLHRTPQYSSNELVKVFEYAKRLVKK